jgi:hypothetical protein
VLWEEGEAGWKKYRAAGLQFRPWPLMPTEVGNDAPESLNVKERSVRAVAADKMVSCVWRNRSLVREGEV